MVDRAQPFSGIAHPPAGLVPGVDTPQPDAQAVGCPTKSRALADRLRLPGVRTGQTFGRILPPTNLLCHADRRFDPDFLGICAASHLSLSIASAVHHGAVSSNF